MEYAVESMETRTWQDEVIAGLQNEITAADDQLYYRDMAIANLEDQVASLQDELGAVRDQAALADRTVTEMYSAARRMKTTRALAGVAALAAAILYVLK